MKNPQDEQRPKLKKHLSFKFNTSRNEYKLPSPAKNEEEQKADQERMFNTDEDFSIKLNKI